MSKLVHLDPRGLEPSVLSVFWQSGQIWMFPRITLIRKPPDEDSAYYL